MRLLALGFAFAAVTACHCGGRLEQVPEGLSVDPPALDFGLVRPAEQKTLSLTLSNTGKLALTVQPKLSSAEFSTQADPVELAPGGKAFLNVVFHPSRDGTFMALLELVSGRSSLGVDLQGRAQGGVASCIPKTCSELGRSCGAADDGCGQALNCGGCSGALACDAEVGACLCPGSGRESCGNGTDDDCDGAADCADSDCAGQGACSAATCSGGAEVRLTQGPRQAAGPDVAWNGSELGVAYMLSNGATPNQALDFGFVRLDANGVPKAPAQAVTSSGLMAHPPRVASNGAEWALASATVSADRTMNLVEVRRVDAAGAPLGSTLVLGQGWPAAIAHRPNSPAFGVLWGSARNPAFTEISSGARVGPDTLVSTMTTWVDYGDLAWNGAGWGAAWTQTNSSNEPGAYFLRFDAAGAALGQPSKLSLGQQAHNPRVAWSGTHYGVVWGETAAPVLGVRFARLDANGALTGAPVAVGPDKSGFADIVWTGTAWAVVWEDGRSAKPAIWLALFDGQGRKLGNDRQVSCGTAGSHHPAVAWTGSALGIAWHDARNGTMDVYFKREVP